MSEQNIDNLIEKTIKEWEGGCVNHPADRGGPTKFGITKQTYEAHIGRTATIEEIKNMPIETAREIYKKNYYFKPKFDQLPNEIQPILFDMGINHGPYRAVKILQTVLNEAGFGPISIDGGIGPQTITTTERAQKEMHIYLNNAIVDERIKFYNSIVERNPSQKVFLKGWLRRAESFRINTIYYKGNL